jgi:hypothetical protein
MTSATESRIVSGAFLALMHARHGGRIPDDLMAELRFLEAWQYDRTAYLNGIVRVRQLRRAQPELAAANDGMQLRD